MINDDANTTSLLPANVGLPQFNKGESMSLLKSSTLSGPQQGQKATTGGRNLSPAGLSPVNLGACPLSEPSADRSC